MGSLGDMGRAATAIAAVVLVLAAPAAAKSGGGSPLLSGYGGPGDGEQALLGQQLYASGSAQRPAGRATGAPAAPSPTAIYQPAAPATAPARTTTPARRSTTSKRARRGRGRGRRPAPPRAAVVPRRGASPAPVVVRPTSAPAPLAGRSLVLAGAVLAALLALGLTARRLAVLSARRRRGGPRLRTAYAARPRQTP